MTTFKRDFKFDYNYMYDISLNIKKYRKEAGITQEQLSVDVGMSYDFIRRLEFKKGEIGCSLDTLYKISVVLNQPMYKFLKKCDPESSKEDTNNSKTSRAIKNNGK